MYFEHVAINIPDPKAFAAWYCEHVGLHVVMSGDAPVNMRFLADVTGRVIMEVYSNDAAPVPDYANQNPLVLHFAFACADISVDKARLLAAGCTEASDATQANGTRLVMLRDPWGIPLQLVQRGIPLFAS